MFLLKQKLVLVAGVVASLILVFFTGKNVTVSYSAVNEILYYEGGYFKANNSIFGGPGCGICLETGEGGCLLRPGIKGYFTEDSACKLVYGPNMVGSRIGKDTTVSVCDLESKEFYTVECFIPAAAPCAQLSQDGVCQKVDTSLLQGGDKDKGDISTEPAQFIVRILTIILSFAGGIALLLILSAGYKVIISKGKPEGMQEGRDQLIAAIIGLVFIIFSFVIFQLVVVDILKIPGIN